MCVNGLQRLKSQSSLQREFISPPPPPLPETPHYVTLTLPLHQYIIYDMLSAYCSRGSKYKYEPENEHNRAPFKRRTRAGIIIVFKKYKAISLVIVLYYLKSYL